MVKFFTAKLVLLFLLFTVGINSSEAHATKDYLVEKSERNKTLGVRVSDLTKYADSIYGLETVIEYLEDVQDYAFNYDKIVEKVHISTLREIPYISQGLAHYPLQVLVEYESGRMVFENITITKNTLSKTLNFSSGRSIDLQETQMKAEVGLIDRVLLVTDQRQGIRLVFPLGVGSFDESILNKEPSLLTPRFKEGYLSKKYAIESRSRPRYFAGKPFIRIMWGSEKEWTGIGFHAQPNLDTFIRAFDSHGCIRMQLDDLHLFYDLVAKNPLLYIPIEVHYDTDSEVDHPFPKINNSYQTVENVGSSSSPMYTIDRDRLVQTTRVNRRAPIHLLRDFPEDDNEEYFNYSGEYCRIKSFEREPSDGWSSHLTNTLAWERCEPRTRRNRLYRWFVH